MNLLIFNHENAIPNSVCNQKQVQNTDRNVFDFMTHLMHTSFITSCSYHETTFLKNA